MLSPAFIAPAPDPESLLMLRSTITQRPGPTPPVAPSFSDVVDQSLLHAVFQPIACLSNGDPIGFEGLIRGPEGTALHSADALFQAARLEQRTLAFESVCRKVVLEQYAALGLRGKLFLNVGPLCFLEDLAATRRLQFLEALGIPPEKIVLELTETEQISDYSLLRKSLQWCRDQGFEIAIDDLGAGYSGLRLWSEINPDYVKIDRHFLKDIAVHRSKMHFIESIQLLAEKSRTITIAEGLETEDDVLTVARIGIRYGQGFVIERPARLPTGNMPATLKEKLLRHSTLSDTRLRLSGKAATVVNVLRAAPTFSKAQTADEVCEAFINNSKIDFAVVIDRDTPLGIINRTALIDRFARPFQRELFGKKSCATFLNSRLLVFEKDTPLQEVSLAIADADARHFSEGFAITDGGRYLGVGKGHDVMREITKMQISAARYANPLTQLPGNVPINEEVDRLVLQGKGFVVCYADLDNFKPFNDVYGYRRGDDIIQLTSRVLAAHCDASRDFLGHIGGDDFIILFSSADWERRCRSILSLFGESIVDYFPADTLEMGGYISADRSGKSIFYPLVSLSLGLVAVPPGASPSHYQIAAIASESKKQAKASAGNTLFLDRRASSFD
ncbi:MAG: GGDEF domain-containing protein [Lacisediminimonas sp.]|nr:GGDEF domain-containing protein [Lacisediminimonas sp.]